MTTDPKLASFRDSQNIQGQSKRAAAEEDDWQVRDRIITVSSLRSELEEATSVEEVRLVQDKIRLLHRRYREMSGKWHRSTQLFANIVGIPVVICGGVYGFRSGLRIVLVRDFSMRIAEILNEPGALPAISAVIGALGGILVGIIVGVLAAYVFWWAVYGAKALALEKGIDAFQEEVDERLADILKF